MCNLNDSTYLFQIVKKRQKNLSELINIYLTFYLRVSQSDMDAFDECRNMVLDTCPHPSTCVFNSVVNEDIKPIDLIDFDDLKNIRKNLCTSSRFLLLEISFCYNYSN